MTPPEILVMAQHTADYPADRGFIELTGYTGRIDMIVAPPALASFSISESTDEDSCAWFWTEEWQKGERRADRDFEEGRFTQVDTIEELLSVLHAEAKSKT